jgi:hypothetical protein
VTNRTSPASVLSNWPASPFIAGALAIIIFVIDTFTPLDIAIAVLYIIVVLMAANFLRRRGVILVSLACAALTVLSFILQHNYSDGSDAIGRCLVSLTAIGITTLLALKRQGADDARRRSERLRMNRREGIFDARDSGVARGVSHGTMGLRKPE